MKLRVIRPRVSINLADIQGVTSFGAALAKCAEISGSPAKTVAYEMDIDAATWSKLKSDAAGATGDFLDRLMDAYGNDFPLFWLCRRRGYDPASLRRLESDLERDNRELREQISKMKQEREVIAEFVRSTSGGKV